MGSQRALSDIDGQAGGERAATSESTPYNSNPHQALLRELSDCIQIRKQRKNNAMQSQKHYCYVCMTNRNERARERFAGAAKRR